MRLQNRDLCHEFLMKASNFNRVSLRIIKIWVK